MARSQQVRDVLLAAGATPTIHEAAATDWLDMVRHLLDTEPSFLNARDTNGRTPLHCAIDGNQLEIARLLLQHGADTRMKWEPGPGWTPIELARRRRLTLMIELLTTRA
jgi:ankyrin repeat protein